jgi:hypothetical protein
MGTVIIRPTRPLPEGATCSLVDRERNVVNWFVVGDSLDQEAPSTPVVSGGRFESGGYAMCGERAASGGLRIEPDRREPKFDNRLFGVWLGVEGQAPNYQEPPVTLSLVDALTHKPIFRYNRSPGINFDLSAVNECKPATFPYPERRQATLGIRALDLAGHWSAPAELVLQGVATLENERYAWGSLDAAPRLSESRLWLWLLLAALALLAGLFVALEATEREL